MSALSLETFLLALPYEVDPKTTKALELSKKNIKSLPSPLTFMAQVRKVNISNNMISDIAPLCTLPLVSQLDLSHNNITSLKPLANLPASAPLTVLNVSHNQLATLEGAVTPETTALTLKALIAAENRLVDISALKGFMAAAADFRDEAGEGDDDGAGRGRGGFRGGRGRGRGGRGRGGRGANNGSAARQPPGLNTLVLSHNPQLLATEESSDEILVDIIVQSTGSQLRKLSLTDTGLKRIPGNLALPLLNELRLAQNQISEFPFTVGLKSLKILDISKNKFENLLSLKPMKYLQQLSIAGNPIVQEVDLTAEENKSKGLAGHFPTQVHVSSVIHKLQILDGKKFTVLERSVVDKAKREMRKGTGKRGRDDEEEDNEGVVNEEEDEESDDDVPHGEGGEDSSEDEAAMQAAMLRRRVRGGDEKEKVTKKKAKKQHSIEDEDLPDVAMDVPKDIEAKANAPPPSIIRKIQRHNVHQKPSEKANGGGKTAVESKQQQQQNKSNNSKQSVAERMKQASGAATEAAGW